MLKIKEANYDNEYEEFISIPINDKYYEGIRKFCIQLYEHGSYANDASESEKKIFEEYLLEKSNDTIPIGINP